MFWTSNEVWLVRYAQCINCSFGCLWSILQDSVCHTFTMWLVVGTALLLAAAVYTLENNNLDRRIDPYACANRKYFMECSHNYNMLNKFPLSNLWPRSNCICSLFLFHMCNNFVTFITLTHIWYIFLSR